MDKQTKEMRAAVRAEIDPELVFVRQLDKMLDEFNQSPAYEIFFTDDDAEILREAQRRIHTIRLVKAFAGRAPTIEEVIEEVKA